MYHDGIGHLVWDTAIDLVERGGNAADLSKRQRGGRPQRALGLD